MGSIPGLANFSSATMAPELFNKGEGTGTDKVQHSMESSKSGTGHKRVVVDGGP